MTRGRTGAPAAAADAPAVVRSPFGPVPAVRRRPYRWATLLVAGAGGLVTESAFPGRSWWPMAYVGVALLLLALRRDSARWGFVVGSVYGLGFFLPLLWWANESVGQPIGWVALSTFQALYLGAFGAVWVTARRTLLPGRSAGWHVATITIIWIAVEQVRGSWPFGGFPWGKVAFSQTDAPVLRLASVGGVPLVSGTVVAVAAVLATALLPLRGRVSGRGLAMAAGAVAAVVVPSLVPLGTAAESGKLRVGAVQGNVPARGADAMGQAREVAANHADGTRALLGAVEPGELDLVLWPESASDIDPRADLEVAAAIDDAAEAVEAPILLGTQRFVPGRRYNDLILWAPGRGADPAVVYTKQRPVPFGEYVPYRSFFRRIAPVVDRIGTDMVAGAEPGVLNIDIARLGRPVPVATAICFEVAFDDLIREGVRRGGEIIVVPTNNASFGLTQESTQQLAMGRLRAVENGRAVVQISTVGVSGLILPDGSVLARTGLFTAEQMVGELPLRTSRTPATRLGEWPGWIAEGLAVLVAAGAIVRGRSGRHRGNS
ncbi:MAG: apolipoprotein N-acyltransferase [Actinomycetales bacterium]|nr:apolipoprotein N-acyltransferase [Actinomycetales bacterium]